MLTIEYRKTRFWLTNHNWPIDVAVFDRRPAYACELRVKLPRQMAHLQLL